MLRLEGNGMQHEPIDPKVLFDLARASTATITTQLFQRGFRNAFLSGLRPLNPAHARFVGGGGYAAQHSGPGGP